MVPQGVLDRETSFAGRFFAVRKSTLKRTQWCVVHRNMCSLENTSDVEIAGMPCQPNSQAGNRLQQEDARFTCYIPWCERHIRQKTVLIILENVVDP